MLCRVLLAVGDRGFARVAAAAKRRCTAHKFLLRSHTDPAPIVENCFGPVWDRIELEDVWK